MKLVKVLTIVMLTATAAHAGFDAVLCLKNTGSGTPKFRTAKPPAPATCKPTEIQLGHFDGTTLQFTGINVQIISGSGATDGAVNGTGNLIVGYNEGSCTASENLCHTDSDCGPSDTCTTSPKTGSHNLVVGGGNFYPTYAGLVAGFGNTISGPFDSVTGGHRNTAGGGFASVSGGSGNISNSNASWVGGGGFNTASAPGASVSGGVGNTASGDSTSVSGGEDNTASGPNASISGGFNLTQPAGNGWAAGTATPGNTINGDFESP
jgi:hypothetical protein